MPPQPPSRAVRSGYVLVTGLLGLALAFGALAVVSVVVGVARGGDSLLYGDPLSVPLQLPPDAVGPLPPGVHLRGWPDVNVDISDPTVEQMLLRSAQDLTLVVVVVAGLWLLRGFLRSVLAGDPFGPSNVQRLRGIGYVLVLGVPAAALLNHSLQLALFNAIPPGLAGGELASRGVAIPGGALLGGLGAFILAEVFAYGLRLRQDVEATV